jgi:hypothetical protein
MKKAEEEVVDAARRSIVGDASIHTVSEAWAVADMATTRLPPARSSKMLQAKHDICGRK